MEFKIPVTKDNVYLAVLTILNFKLGLSKQELDMLSVILQNKITTIDISSRELLRKVMDRNKFDINNYVKRLKEKKIILQDGKKLFINPSVIALASETTLTFNFIL